MNSDYNKSVVISATELKQNFGKYMDHVEQQNEVVITRNGKKTARLTPYITDWEQYLLAKERALDYQYGGKKVSYEEFMEICEKSTLRMEFINGEIILLTSPSISHQEILGRLYLIFHEYFKKEKCRVFLAPFDVHCRKRDIDEPDVMQPDLLVVCDLDNNVTDEDRYMGTPTLCLEILSNNTRNRDMIDKLNTYRLSGVKEYWIIDPIQNNIMVYSFDNYEIDRYTIFVDGIAQSYVFPGLSADVRELFGGLV